METNDRSKLIWNVLKILIALVLVWYVFSHTDLNEIFTLRERMVTSYLIATFLLYVVLTALKAFKYQVFLQRDTQYLRVLNVVVLQNAISNFFASSVGIVSYLTMLKVEENVNVEKSGPVFLITMMGDLFAVWLVMLGCGLLYWEQISGAYQPFLFFEILIGMVLALFFGVIFFRSSFVDGFSRSMDRLGLTKFSWTRKLLELVGPLGQIEPRVIMQNVFVAFGLSLFYYFLTLVWQVISLYTFNFHAEIWVIVFVSGILQLFSMLPINIFGGLGVTESTAFYLYPILGADPNDLSLILLGWRILYYLTNFFVLLYLPFYTFFIEPRIKPKR